MSNKKIIEANDLEIVLKQVQKLELENQIMKERTAPLIYENEELRAQLADQKRLRNQVKGLLSAIDKTLTVHIDKLNAHSVPAEDSTLDQSITKLDANATLRIIHDEDISRFYNQKFGVAVRDRKAYVAVNGIYQFTKRISRKILLFVWLGAKRLKGVIR